MAAPGCECGNLAPGAILKIGMVIATKNMTVGKAVSFHQSKTVSKSRAGMHTHYEDNCGPTQKCVGLLYEKS